MTAVWEVISRAGVVSTRYFPAPSEVGAAASRVVTDTRFQADALSTVLSWMIALSCATFIGATLGICVGMIAALRRVILPVVNFLRPLPSAALIPLGIVVIGAGAQLKITLAVIAATWPILLNTVHAVDHLDRAHLETARLFRSSRWTRLTVVTLPSVCPFLLTGVRISAAIALIVLVGTEFLVGGTIGIGQYAYMQGSAAGQMDLVVAATVLAATVNVLFDAAAAAVQRRWLQWAAPEDASL